MNKTTIDGIRIYYNLSESVTDEQIQKTLRGSLGEAVVNLNIAVRNFTMAVEKATPKFKKLFELSRRDKKL